MAGISIPIPTNWNLPLFWAVVDPSMAGNLTESQPAILMGEKIAAGSAALNLPIPIGSTAQAKSLFGDGSPLAREVEIFLAGNPTQQLWACPVAEPGAGVAALGSIAITHVATAAGVYTVYIAGQRVQVVVNSTDATTLIATNLAAAINAITSLPVTAVASTSTVNLTTKWKGLNGNDIIIRENLLGLNGGEQMPTAMTTTITAMATGAGQPDCTTAIANLAGNSFRHWCVPWNDASNMTAFDTELGFGPTGRWAYLRQDYAWAYSAKRGDYASLMTWGASQNSPVISTMVYELTTPSPQWEIAAAYCAQGSAALLADAARPLQTLEFPGLQVAPPGERFSNTMLNNLTNTGMAIQRVSPSGRMMILREQMQYQKNSYGQADTAFSLMTILSNLAELLDRMRAAITTKYPRHKLAPDNTRFGPGQAILTPSTARAELVAEARVAEFDGLMSNVDAFKKNLLVEIDDNNPNRLNVLWPPQLMGQLREFDVLAQFRLLYRTIDLT